LLAIQHTPDQSSPGEELLKFQPDVLCPGTKYLSQSGTHVYNPSYSGGRDWADQGLKPAQANSSIDSILKKITN
jgi:hypothetical protein